jgi:ABC-type Fe3+/spermidine/putrescine transport system ATPase subunit
MGTTNLLSGTVIGQDGAALRIQVGEHEFHATGTAGKGDSVSFSLRPEAIRLLKASEWAPPGWSVFDAAFGSVEFLGAITRIELKIGNGGVLRVASLDVLPTELAHGRVVAAYDPRRITVFPQ